MKSIGRRYEERARERLQSAACSGGDGAVEAAAGVNYASDCGGGEDISYVGLPSVASGDSDENTISKRLTVVAHGGSGGCDFENMFVTLPCSTVSSGGGGGEGPGVAAPAVIEGASLSTPKRKRGRPKGSKNKPRPANETEPKRKRGRPAGSKSSPKCSLTQAMGHAESQTHTVPQPLPQSVRQEDSAAPNAVENESAAAGPMLPGTIVSSTSSPAGGAHRTSPARPHLIPGLYVDTMVAFSPAREGWTKRQKAEDKFRVPDEG
ncbi:unnamed protein product [Phytophthora fragariaefolia]|uniref:Unnamed protein product n=1 Tax=Phytophthora fragariaefolia TaxID=1490495 RepID=A0A9W7CSV2_9STRA|nr:unnamed protein product [Phytophthora fragariaefolia]